MERKREFGANCDRVIERNPERLRGVIRFAVHRDIPENEERVDDLRASFTCSNDTLHIGETEAAVSERNDNILPLDKSLSGYLGFINLRNIFEPYEKKPEETLAYAEVKDRAECLYYGAG